MEYLKTKAVEFRKMGDDDAWRGMIEQLSGIRKKLKAQH